VWKKSLSVNKCINISLLLENNAVVVNYYLNDLEVQRLITVNNFGINFESKLTFDIYIDVNLSLNEFSLQL